MPWRACDASTSLARIAEGREKGCEYTASGLRTDGMPRAFDRTCLRRPPDGSGNTRFALDRPTRHAAVRRRGGVCASETTLRPVRV